MKKYLVKLIKVIKIKDYYECPDCYHDFATVVADGIYEWEEIDEENFQFLMAHSYILWKEHGLLVIQQPQEEKELLPTKIKELRKYIEDENKKRKERDLKYKNQEQERKEKARLAKIEKAKKLLEKEGVFDKSKKNR